MGGDDGGGSGGGGGCVGVVDCEGVCKGGGLWSVVYGCGGGRGVTICDFDYMAINVPQ